MTIPGTYIHTSKNIYIKDNILYGELKNIEGNYVKSSIRIEKNISYYNVNGYFSTYNLPLGSYLESAKNIRVINNLIYIDLYNSNGDLITNIIPKNEKFIYHNINGTLTVDIKFNFIKRINTTKNSIFYSLIKKNNEIIAFGRKYYGKERIIKKIKLDENFDIIEDNDIYLKGEDPRCFEYNNKIYVLDNYSDDMFLIDYENKKYIKINISGKNISFINHNNTLYFIHYMKPFELYTFDIETENILKIDVNNEHIQNYQYRGGTPGYKLSENQYYGFGHKTYTENNILKHDIFKWIVDFEDKKLPKITHFDIIQPINSKNICDPTSVIEINNKKYLISAESEESWVHEQDYITNVYEIIE